MVLGRGVAGSFKVEVGEMRKSHFQRGFFPKFLPLISVKFLKLYSSKRSRQFCISFFLIDETGLRPFLLVWQPSFLLEYSDDVSTPQPLGNQSYKRCRKGSDKGKELARLSHYHAAKSRVTCPAQLH